MGKRMVLVLGVLLLCGQARAQQEQFMITSPADKIEMRRQETIPEEYPPVSLRKTADFLVLRVQVENDSRDVEQRRAEVDQNLQEMIRAASQGGRIQLHSGEYPMKENGPALALTADRDRPDAAYACFFVKVPLKGEDDVRKLTQEMLSFVSKTKLVGRTQLHPGEVGLSMVDPDQYRYELLQKIAADVAKAKGIFGGDVPEIHGLDKRVKVRRAGVTEVELYLSYGFTLQPSWQKATTAEVR